MSNRTTLRIAVAGLATTALCAMGPVAFAPLASALEAPCQPIIVLSQGSSPTSVDYTVTAAASVPDGTVCDTAIFTVGPSSGGEVEPGQSMSGSVTTGCATRVDGYIEEQSVHTSASTAVMSGIYVPNTPNAPQLSAATTSTIRAVSSANIDNCHPIDSFEFRTSTGVSASAADPAATLSGLTPGTTYSITVMAKNGAGNSPVSAATSMATAANPSPTKPSAPQGLTVTNIGTTTARAAWTPPATAGTSPVTGYTVTLNGMVVGTGANTAQDFSGLTAKTAYTVSVAAVSAAGTGATATANFRTTVAPVVTTVPAAVVNLQVSSVNSSSAVISWQAPTSTGGSPVTSYTVTNTTTKESRPVAANVTSAQFSLAPSAAYLFTVQAVNANGAGPAASVGAVTPSAAAPDRPSQTITVGLASSPAWKSGKSHYAGSARSSAGNKVQWRAKGKYVKSVKATTKGGKAYLKITLKKGSPKLVTVTITARANGDAGHDPASVTNSVSIAR